MVLSFTTAKISSINSKWFLFSDKPIYLVLYLLWPLTGWSYKGYTTEYTSPMKVQPGEQSLLLGLKRKKKEKTIMAIHSDTGARSLEIRRKTKTKRAKTALLLSEPIGVYVAGASPPRPPHLDID